MTLYELLEDNPEIKPIFWETHRGRHSAVVLPWDEDDQDEYGDIEVYESNPHVIENYPALRIYQELIGPNATFRYGSGWIIPRDKHNWESFRYRILA